jgi:hypothetical protein
MAADNADFEKIDVDRRFRLARYVSGFYDRLDRRRYARGCLAE